jgi:nucleoside-diphosphate-sugar epimerase
LHRPAGTRRGPLTAEQVLLLGASGFIGRHVAAALAASGFGVVSVARRSPPGPSSAGWLVGDLTDAAFVRHALDASHPSVIVNCAGASSGSDDVLWRANVLPVWHLRDELRGEDAVRVVHLGSAVEYGPVTPGAPISESHPARPLGGYGRAKLEATTAVLAMAGPGQGVVLRLFNVLGAGLSAESVIGAAAAAIREAQSAQADEIQLGALDAFRDFVHVADVADAVVAAVGLAEAADPVVNIGSGQATLVREAVRRLAGIAGFAGRVAESQALGSRRSEAIPWLQADISRAVSMLGWRPTRTLDQALRDAWSGTVTVQPTAP